MPDRRAKILRLVCLILGGLLAIQLAIFAVHATFSRGLNIPDLPSLPPGMEANAPTNSPTTTTALKSATNSASTNAAAKGKTNSVATNSALGRTDLTNSSTTTGGPSNTTPGEAKQANESAKAETNQSGIENSLSPAGGEGRGEEAVITNRVSKTGTNTASGTNVALNTTNSPADKTGTNSSAKGPSKKGAMPGGRPGAPQKIADLPAPVKERIDRITQGEILAPVMRPLPMGLLGIAGQSAFLRSADGQTGLVKEGDSLGTLKLLRIGTNRVLVEVDGEKKELMIFAGLGSESLLPKPDKSTNEPPKKTR
jgi:hypothetical protein